MNLSSRASNVDPDATHPPNSASDHTHSPGDGVELVVEGLRALGPERSLRSVQKLITTVAAASLPGASDAALSVCNSDTLSTVAQTGPWPLEVDALQYKHGGPCVDVATTPTAVAHADDLRTDTRWPTFTHAALEQTPVLSVLSYRLFLDHGDRAVVGSLNLYATRPHAFTSDTVMAGERLAAYTTVVLAYAAAHDKAVNLERALHSNRDIGAAIGILMTRHLITRDRAFQLLSAASQRANRKLRELAEDVIDTGDLPGHGRPEPGPSCPTPTSVHQTMRR